jgi:acetoin utilization deacetylase AcuC-like enzyme
MKIFYHDLFTFPLPTEHRFPISKYARLRERILVANEIPPTSLLIPDAASDEQLALGHSREYIERVKQGALDEKEIRRMGFPWSPDLVERSRRSVGSSIAACRAALKESAAVNLAGGTHHAGKGHGEGFCIFNDAAIAALVMLDERRAKQILIIDTDVHQGNGTAEILHRHPGIFTFSIHGQNNFPFRKSESDLDIGLPDGVEDDHYLKELEKALGMIAACFTPDLAIFISGADPYSGDRLGRLQVSKQGLAQRDALVFAFAEQHNLPIAVAMGGGYAEVDDVVDIHYETVRQAFQFWMVRQQKRISS